MFLFIGIGIILIIWGAYIIKSKHPISRIFFYYKPTISNERGFRKSYGLCMIVFGISWIICGLLFIILTDKIYIGIIASGISITMVLLWGLYSLFKYCKW